VVPKLRVLLLTVAIVLLLDLPSKGWVSAHLMPHERIPVIDGVFLITHARNPGAAFGLFESVSAPRRLAAFLGVSVLAFLVIFSFYRRLAPGDRRNAAALALVLGGTLGNLYDRLVRGEVIDLLHVRLWTGYVWPDFNVADVAIVVGVATLILELLVGEALARAAPLDDAR